MDLKFYTSVAKRVKTISQESKPDKFLNKIKDNNIILEHEKQDRDISNI